MKERLEILLGTPVRNIAKLHGDASYRTYYRIETGRETLILMALPEGKLSVSEEITNLKEKTQEMPFINVQKFLKGLSLPVPEIKLFSEKDRWLFLEDLGDDLLYKHVAKANAKTRLEWYQKALDLLINLQTSTHRHIGTSRYRDNKCIAFNRSFDATLLNWEFDHFWEYYVKIKNKEETLFKEFSRKITEQLCQLPQGFVHRDYQSRNLIWHREKFYLLDFQDALLGPYIYDLVSLLRDSYISLSQETIQILVQHYADQTGKSPKTVQRDFDLQTVQRKLKDVGRFVFIDRIKKNPNYLPFIPTSLKYVQEALKRLPEYNDFYLFLKNYIPEWQ